MWWWLARQSTFGIGKECNASTIHASLEGQHGICWHFEKRIKQQNLRHVMGSTASQKRPTQAESFITSTNLDKMRWYYCPCSHEMQQRSTSIAGASEYHIGQSIQMQGCAVRWWLVVTRNSARRICTFINGTIELTLWSKNQGFEKRQ